MKLDDIRAELPPIYRLISLMTMDGPLNPRVPVQLLSEDEQHIRFRTFSTYGMLPVFVQKTSRYHACHITEITYDIIVYGGAERQSITARYCHKFREPVYFNFDRMSRSGSMGELVTYSKALEHLPVLPNGWSYFQFID